MSAMEDRIRVIVHDAEVVTVPLVDNLTASNAAPKASTVGAAINRKADADRVMEYVTITFDGVESDLQGVIIATGEDIPADSSQNAKSIAETFTEIAGQITDAIDEAVRTAQTGVVMLVENIAPDATTHNVSLAGLMATAAEVETMIDQVLAGQ